jgi:hypothetical protein
MAAPNIGNYHNQGVHRQVRRGKSFRGWPLFPPLIEPLRVYPRLLEFNLAPETKQDGRQGWNGEHRCDEVINSASFWPMCADHPNLEVLKFWRYRRRECDIFYFGLHQTQ